MSEEEEIFPQFISAIDTLTADADAAVINESTSFLQNLMNNNRVIFISSTLKVISNPEESQQRILTSLILLRTSLKESNSYGSLDSIRYNLVQNENQELMDAMFNILLPLMFGENESLQKPASEAFARAYAIFAYCSGLWGSFSANFFSQIKPDTLESALPTLGFFIDLFTSSFYKEKTDLADDPLLNDFVNLILTLISSEFVNEGTDLSTYSIYIKLALNAVFEMIHCKSLFNFLVSNNRFLHFLDNCKNILGISDSEIFSKVFEIIENFAEIAYFNLDKRIKIGENIRPDGKKEDVFTTYWDIISEYLNNCVTCEGEEYIMTTITFVKTFAKFEFNLFYSEANYNYFVDNTEWKVLNIRRVKSDMQPKCIEPFTKRIIFGESAPILQFLFTNIFNINEEMITSGNKECFSVPYSVAKAFRYVFMLVPNSIGVAINIIREKVQSSSYCDIYGALLLLESIVIRFQYNPVRSFLDDCIKPLIELITVNDEVEIPSIVITGATIVLTRIFGLYENGLIQPYFFDVLKASFMKYTNVSERIIRYDFGLLGQLIDSLPKEIICEVFPAFADIMMQMLSPELPAELLLCFEDVLIKFIYKCSGTSDELLKRIFDRYVEISKDICQKASEQNPISQIFNFVSHIVTIISKMYTKNADFSKPKDIFDVLSPYLNFMDPQLYYVIYINFVDLINEFKEAFNEAGFFLMKSAYDSMGSGIPKLIGVSGLLIGTCLKHLTTDSIKEIGYASTGLILDALYSQREEIFNDPLSSLIEGFSFAICGSPASFPVDQIDAFKGILKNIVSLEFDTENVNMVDLYHRIYRSILIAYKNIAIYHFKLADEKIQNIDKAFVKEYKNVVFRDFIKKKLFETNMYKDHGVIIAFIDLIDTLITRFKYHFNIQCNNKWVTPMLKYALWERWEDASQDAEICLKHCCQN